jgi:hypothetical protein
MWIGVPTPSHSVIPCGCTPKRCLEGLAGWKNITSDFSPSTVSPSWRSQRRTSFAPQAAWAAAESKVAPEAYTAPSST